MSWKQDKERLILWACVVLLAAMGSILGFMGSRLWSNDEAHGNDISELKANRVNDHEAIQEIRQDVKELLRRTP